MRFKNTQLCLTIGEGLQFNVSHHHVKPTCCFSEDEPDVAGDSVRVLEVPEAPQPAQEEADVDDDEQEGEGEELEVVPQVGHAELVGHVAQQRLRQAVRLLRLGRHQPTVDRDRQVLQETLVLRQLGLVFEIRRLTNEIE